MRKPDLKRIAFTQNEIGKAAKAGKIEGFDPYRTGAGAAPIQDQQDRRAADARKKQRMGMDSNKMKFASPEERQRMMSAPYADSNALKQWGFAHAQDIDDAYQVDQAKRRKGVQDKIREAGGSGAAHIEYNNPGTAARLNGTAAAPAAPAPNPTSTAPGRGTFQKRTPGTLA